MRTMIVGIGGGGITIARRMATRFGCRAVFVNTDAGRGSEKFLDDITVIGESTCRGSSAVVSTRGQRAAEESRRALERLVSGYARVVLVACLGGGTGSGATPIMARIAREAGAHVVCAVTLPFEFEQKSREQALEGLNELENDGFALVRVSNANVSRDQASKSLVDLLEQINERLVNKVRRLIEASG